MGDLPPDTKPATPPVTTFTWQSNETIETVAASNFNFLPSNSPSFSSPLRYVEFTAGPIPAFQSQPPSLGSMSAPQGKGASSSKKSGSSSEQPRHRNIRFINTTSDGQPHMKRRRINAACKTCQRRKTRCSGEHPICSTCTQNGHECLGYTTSKNKNNQKGSQASGLQASDYEESEDDLLASQDEVSISSSDKAKSQFLSPETSRRPSHDSIGSASPQFIRHSQLRQDSGRSSSTSGSSRSISNESVPQRLSAQTQRSTAVTSQYQRRVSSANSEGLNAPGLPAQNRWSQNTGYGSVADPTPALQATEYQGSYQLPSVVSSQAPQTYMTMANPMRHSANVLTSNPQYLQPSDASLASYMELLGTGPASGIGASPSLDGHSSLYSYSEVTPAQPLAMNQAGGYVATAGSSNINPQLSSQQYAYNPQQYQTQGTVATTSQTGIHVAVPVSGGQTATADEDYSWLENFVPEDILSYYDDPSVGGFTDSTTPQAGNRRRSGYPGSGRPQ